MSERHPFHDIDPHTLDCGDLIDMKTQEVIRPATAEEADRSIKADQQKGIIVKKWREETVLAYVRPPEGMSLEDWQLAVELKLADDLRRETE